MTKAKLSRRVLLLLLVALCLSLVAVLTPLLSSPVLAAGSSKATSVISDVNILSPVGAVPVTVTPGERVDISVEITVTSTCYYTVTIQIVDSAAVPPVVVGSATQYILLFQGKGDNNINKEVSITSGVTGDVYDVVVTADLAANFDPATSPSDTEEGAVIVGNTQESSPVTTDEGAVRAAYIRGASLTAQLIGKSLLIVSALLDKVNVDTVDTEEGAERMAYIRGVSFATQLIGKSALMIGALIDKCQALGVLDDGVSILSGLRGFFSTR